MGIGIKQRHVGELINDFVNWLFLLFVPIIVERVLFCVSLRQSGERVQPQIIIDEFIKWNASTWSYLSVAVTATNLTESGGGGADKSLKEKNQQITNCCRPLSRRVARQFIFVEFTWKWGHSLSVLFGLSEVTQPIVVCPRIAITRWSSSYVAL